jgi:hypothetical protein
VFVFFAFQQLFQVILHLAECTEGYHHQAITVTICIRKK